HGAPTGIIALGGGVIQSEISAGRGEVAVGRTVERIIAAAELARRYPGARVVFAGAGEGDFVIHLLEKFGVSKDRVIVEQASRNTVENAAFAKQLFMPKSGERWLLVTSAMHMPRAVGVFGKAGFAVDAYPVEYLTSGAKDLWTLPGALMGGIGITDLAVHEWFGLLAYWITGRISVPFPGPMSEILLPAGSIRQRLRKITGICPPTNSEPALHNADNPSQYHPGDATAKQLADNGANIHGTGRAHDARQEKLLQNLTSNATANCARDGVAQRAKTNI